MYVRCLTNTHILSFFFFLGTVSVLVAWLLLSCCRREGWIQVTGERRAKMLNVSTPALSQTLCRSHSAVWCNVNQSVGVPHGLVAATRLMSLRFFGEIQTLLDHHLESTLGLQLHYIGLRAPRHFRSFVQVVPTGVSDLVALGSVFLVVRNGFPAVSRKQF